MQEHRPQPLLLTLTCVTALASISASARAQERSPDAPEEIGAAKPIGNAGTRHRLGAAPYASCERGACTSGFRDVWSNVSAEETQRLREQEDRKMRNVRAQLRGLGGINDATSRLLDRASELTESGQGDELLEVVLYLEEEPFDFTRLRPLRASSKRSEFLALGEERRAQLRPSQDRATRFVERSGGQVLGRLRFSNALIAEIPSNAIISVLGKAPIVGADLSAPVQSSADGRQRRAALGLPNGGISGLNGQEGSLWSGDTEVLYGIIDVDGLNTSHVSFLDWTTGPSRILRTKQCKYWTFGFDCAGSAATTAATHGTTVTSVLLSSVEQGQDPGATDTSTQQRRSGIATEAHAVYYKAPSEPGVATAIEHAVWTDGVDIINLSMAATGSDLYCSNSSNGGVREAIRAATQAGTLVVVAAGNDANEPGAPSCNVNSFAVVPQALAVGATDIVATLDGLSHVDLADYSGRGTFSVTLDGGRVASGRAVDLLANGDVLLTADAGATGYGGATGTSFSTPQISALAGLLLDWVKGRGGLTDVYGNGGLERSPYALRTLLSVMGDGVNSTGGSFSYLSSLSSHSGFGHMRFIDLDNEIGNGAWGLHRYYVTEGQVIEWSVGSTAAESTAVKGWKMAALWDEDYYGGSADIKFQLIDKCPSGGGQEVVYTATRFPLKAAMRMRESNMPYSFHGRCLYVRATVEHADGVIPLYAADYFYTNDRKNHDMN